MSSILRSVSFRSYRKGPAPVAPIDTHEFHYGPNELHMLQGKFSYLAEMGGAQGIATMLRSDVKNGIYQDEVDQLTPFQTNQLAQSHSQSPKEAVDQSVKPRRIETYGTNEFAKPVAATYLELCWEIMQDPMLILLSIAGIISIALGLVDSLTHGWYEGVAIIFAVALVVIVGATNEWNQQRQLASLDRSEEADLITVIRGGKSTQIHPDLVVVGDVVLLSAGGFVPADGIIIADDSIKVNESKMTGESKDIAKNFYDPFLFGGTEVKEGQATMLITAVGQSSAYGRIMSALAAEPEQTPLQIKLERVAAFIGYVGGAIALILFIVLFSRWLNDEVVGKSVGSDELNELLKIVIISVTIIVVAVPEGLPLAVTVSLAYSMKKMYSDKIVVHKLAACETMGNATTICSDKTGTLTQNLMTVNSVFLGNKFYNNSIPTKDELVNGASNGLIIKYLIEAVVVNSKAWVADEERDMEVPPERWAWKEGNQTEVSLMSWMARYDIDFNLERIKYPVEKSCPFDSIKKQSSVILSLDFINRTNDQTTKSIGQSNNSNVTASAVNQIIAAASEQSVQSNNQASKLGVPALNQSKLQAAADRDLIAQRVEERLQTQRDFGESNNQSGYRRYFKGAAEVIVAKCSHIIDESGQRRPLTDMESKNLISTVDSMTRKGLRTIAFSFIDYDKLQRDEDGSLIEPNDDDEGAVFIGCVGIKDPLRVEAYGAVRTCQRAGVIVRMVTGDHIETAKFIARECGILTSDKHIAMLGEEFRTMITANAEERLLEVIPRLRVLARSKPEDKEMLVNWLKKHGQVVAATGDGTNDAPALKAANVGLAMYIAGTAVAKAAAEIWILDDNFNSIVSAIMWGRAVYDNIRKFVQFQATVNVVALSIAVIGALAGFGEPLTAVQLLWVNLIMDTFAALALGTEHPQRELLLRRKPYKPDAFIISPVMARNIIGQSIYQVVVLLLLLFAGDYYDVVNNMSEREHYTIIFNTFVFMQLFNEINSRRVNREVNVFENLFDNWLFSAVIVGTIGVQIIMVELAGDFASTTGLTYDRWLVCVALGFGALPIGFLQRLIPVNYEFGEIDLDPDTFEGAHLGNTLYDQQRPSSRDIHKNVEASKSMKDPGPNGEPLMATTKDIEMV